MTPDERTQLCLPGSFGLFYFRDKAEETKPFENTHTAVLPSEAMPVGMQSDP